MSFKTILVPVDRHDRIAAVFDCAAALGRIGGGYIEAVPIRSLMADVYIAGAFGGVPVPQVPGTGASVDDLRRIADAELQRLGITKSPISGTGLRASWREIGPLDDISLSARARAFDITVFGRANRDGSGPRMGVLEATLFESGRPILIAPPRFSGNFGDKIVIAWNGSTETARAVGFAMPLLERAKKVLMVSVAGMLVPGPTGADLAASLQANGIAVEERLVSANGRTSGEVFLAEAAAWGADLMIKGAYTQSRLRQMIFGGATSHILVAAELPVFMAH